jgi:hypothetical protein
MVNFNTEVWNESQFESNKVVAWLMYNQDFNYVWCVSSFHLFCPSTEFLFYFFFFNVLDCAVFRQ